MDPFFQRPINFLMVGSCDGIFGNDFLELIERYKWKCIFVEPIEYVFNLLLKNYSDSENHTYIHSAVDLNRERYEREVFYIKDEKLNIDEITIFMNWEDANADRERGSDGLICREVIQFVPLEDLIKEYKVDMVHLNYIDFPLISDCGFHSFRSFGRTLSSLNKNGVKYLSYENDVNKLYSSPLDEEVYRQIINQYNFRLIEDSICNYIEPTRRQHLIKNEN